MVVLQRLNESARIARRHDDDPPFDACVVQQLPQARRRQLDERQRRQVGAQVVLAAAVACKVDHHDVVFDVDRGADLVQRLAQVGDRRERRRQQRLRIVDEQHGAPGRVPALVHHVLRGLDILPEHVLATIGCKADEIEVGRARPLVHQLGEHVVEQEALRCEHGFRSGRHAFRRRCGPGLVAPPRLVGRDGIREPDRRSEQEAAEDCAKPDAGYGRRERHRHAAHENGDHPQLEHAPGQRGAHFKRQRSAVQQGHEIVHHLRERHRRQDDHGHRECEHALAEQERDQRRSQQQ